MNWLLGISLIFVILFMINNFVKKRNEKRLKESIIESWGKKKDDYFNFNLIERYFKNSSKDNIFHLISDRTSKDIDLDKVFEFIDRTTSKIGQQYLYYKLRVLKGKEALRVFDLFSKEFSKDKKLTRDTQFELAKLSSNDTYYFEDLIGGEQIPKSKWLGLIYILALCSVVALLLSVFSSPVWGLILVPIFLINAVFHYANKGSISYYLMAINQMSIALKVSKNLSKHNVIKNHFQDISFISEIEKIKFKTKFIGLEKRISDDVTSLLWVAIELVKIMFNIELIVFHSFVDSVTNKKESLNHMFKFIGEIDSAISVASLRDDAIQKCDPEFSVEKRLVSKKIIHPLIDKCISNDCDVSDKSILLTGSNMSGKTTFIRTIAVNSLLAQTLNLCFAEAYKAPYFKLFTSIQISDNLNEEKSYYLEEVLTIKELIDSSKSGTPCLFVLDEIFKGTNTVERISGGKSILSYLNSKRHFVIVSTHDIELTDLLKDQYDLYHFSEHVENDKLLFDHKLKKGRLKTRNAIKILELYGYPEEVVRGARVTEKQFL